MKDVYKTVVSRVPQLARGLVWCRKCGAEQRVNSGNAMQYGWPKCCGETMTIDSPSERVKLGKAPAEATNK